MQTETTLDGLAFPECPRWHQGKLWFTDQHDGRILAASPNGGRETIATTKDRPGGLGWLPDGSLLVVMMTTRRVLRLRNRAAGLEPYADLAELAPWHCNDMLVDELGRAYVGNFGYDVDAEADETPTQLIRIDRDGSSQSTGGPLIFPNGMAITADGATLLCAETFAHRVSAFTREADGTLSRQRIWADLGDGATAPNPDGICIDAEGALWVASPATGEVLRVREGGKVVSRLRTAARPYACMLGGRDRRTLFICSADTHDPAQCAKLRSGRIETATVDVPGAGLP